jgi:hypothetical protein
MGIEKACLYGQEDHSNNIGKEVGMVIGQVVEFVLLTARGAMLGLFSLLFAVLASALPMGLQWLFR